MRRRGEEKGQIILLFLAVLVVLLGVTGMVIDAGLFFLDRAKLSRAADAAALAGAMKLPNGDVALAAAKNMTSANGLTDGENGVVVTGVVTPDGRQNCYGVEIIKPRQFYFMWLFGIRERNVRAWAVAECFARQPVDIWGTGTYGSEGAQSLEISGPYAWYSYGDPYCTMFLNDGSPNPEFNPDAYNFNINIPSTYQGMNGTSIVDLELYDATMGSSNDERYSSHGKSYRQTKTIFTLYAPDDTPDDYSDDVAIATAVVNPNDSNYKLKWVAPGGFEFDAATYGCGNYRVSVKTEGGSGGNAFHMRAGPPREAGEAFDPNNGTFISGIGTIQMFFLSSGTVHTTLGYIPPEAAGMEIHIKKFDTDVGAKTITYTDSTGVINWPGVLSSNGTWKEDVYTVPAGYPGGTLLANYTAGRYDTSIWEMWYSGFVPGMPRRLRLVE